jgi:molecular chaperone DnaJ
MWHPDVNPSPLASSRFKSICEAYAVLSDAKRRAVYDSNLKGVENRWSPSTGELKTAITISLAEGVLGCQRSVRICPLIHCKDCSGTGLRPGGLFQPCDLCAGKGDIIKAKQKHNVGVVHKQQAVCPACSGKGGNVIDRCRECHGVGRMYVDQAVVVDVPPGTEDLAVMIIPGQGNVFGLGTGVRGDLRVTIHVQSDDKVQRRGFDLHSDVDVPLVVAMLGGVMTVPLINGSIASLEVPAGTQHGTTLSLRNEGVLGRGNHYFLVNIEIPKCTSPRERQVALELSRLHASSTFFT